MIACTFGHRERPDLTLGFAHRKILEPLLQGTEWRIFRACSPNTCPDLKGIKTNCCDSLTYLPSPNTCPDLKGIKTPGFAGRPLAGRCRPNTCPDLKGIKTRIVHGNPARPAVRTPALISKGLRRSPSHRSHVIFVRTPALISGIKTELMRDSSNVRTPALISRD